MFHLRELFDCFAAEEKRKQQRGDRGIGRSKSDILKDVERLDQIPFLIFEMAEDQFVEDVIDHSFSVPVSDRLQFVVLPSSQSLLRLS